MQIRDYPEKDGKRIWLSRDERARLLGAVEDDPRRQLAIRLGCHGLRTDELVAITPGDVRELDGELGGSALAIGDGKTGRRQVPISAELAESIRYFASAAQLRQGDELIDVGKRQIRNWLADARSDAAELDAGDAELWELLGMHDLRRSWATDCYYTLALAGVPIAEKLVLSWGGWAQSEGGRDMFRRHYLGPVPDEITATAREKLGYGLVD